MSSTAKNALNNAHRGEVGIPLFLLAVVLSFTMPLGAAGGKASKYPLHIQIRTASYGCSDCVGDNGPPGSLGAGGAVGAADLANPNLATIDPDHHYFGNGSGVLLLAHKTQAFYFGYQGCVDPLPLTKTASLAARWKKQGSTLEVRVPAYSPKKPVKFAAKHLSTCQVDFSLKPIPLVHRKGSPEGIGH